MAVRLRQRVGLDFCNLSRTLGSIQAWGDVFVRSTRRTKQHRKVDGGDAWGGWWVMDGRHSKHE